MRCAAMVLGLCLALGACSNNLYSYARTGTDAVATQTDIEACNTAMAPYASSDEAKEIFDRCMAGKGYEKRVFSE